jgi:AraC family transcriptional regulator
MGHDDDPHRARVQRALEYIMANLHRPISLAEVARTARTSEFHFHRIFTAVMNETPGQLIARTRLEIAAQKLAYEPSLSVTEIAASCGFSSTANFSKAFSAYFGCSPREVRRPMPKKSKLGKLFGKHGKAFSPADLYSLPAPLDETERERRLEKLETGHRIERRAATPVICLASKRGYDPTAAMAIWTRLIRHVRRLGIAESEVDAYGILHASPQLTAPHLCRYHACVPIAADVEIAPPFFRDVLHEGRYAAFRHTGPVAALEDTYRDIYSLWLPSSGLVPDDYRPIDHYDKGPPENGHIDMEILIRARPKRAM